ncbi:MAG: hypothetical protein QGD88_13275, partial [Anaerolineae bacterium]|nr:hypothetical protein [Anaerolineae bacterium]
YIFEILNNVGLMCEQIIGVSLFRERIFKKLIPIKLLNKADDVLGGFSGKYFLTPSIFIKSRKQS